MLQNPPRKWWILRRWMDPKLNLEFCRYKNVTFNTILASQPEYIVTLLLDRFQGIQCATDHMPKFSTVVWNSTSIFFLQMVIHMMMVPSRKRRKVATRVVVLPRHKFRCQHEWYKTKKNKSNKLSCNAGLSSAKSLMDPSVGKENKENAESKGSCSASGGIAGVNGKQKKYCRTTGKRKSASSSDNGDNEDVNVSMNKFKNHRQGTFIEQLGLVAKVTSIFLSRQWTMNSMMVSRNTPDRRSKKSKLPEQPLEYCQVYIHWESHCIVMDNFHYFIFYVK